jgi:hypothetical protein
VFIYRGRAKNFGVDWKYQVNLDSTREFYFFNTIKNILLASLFEIVDIITYIKIIF